MKNRILNSLSVLGIAFTMGLLWFAGSQPVYAKGGHGSRGTHAPKAPKKHKLPSTTTPTA